METQPQFQGAMVKLIAQFATHYGLGVGVERSGERLGVICRILETPRSTAEHWFKKSVSPTAERARKLQLLFSLCGFEAEERALLTSTMKTFVDTLVTAVTPEEAAKELGVTVENLMYWVRGTTQPKRMQGLVEFNHKHASRRQARIKEWRQLLSDNGFISNEPRVSEVSLPPAVLPRMFDMQHADKALVHQMKALRAMITSSGVLSDDARKKEIRKSVGHNEVAELIGDLQRLSLATFNLNNHP